MAFTRVVRRLQLRVYCTGREDKGTPAKYSLSSGCKHVCRIVSMLGIPQFMKLLVVRLPASMRVSAPASWVLLRMRAMYVNDDSPGTRNNG
jgi:hypothetical protein